MSAEPFDKDPKGSLSQALQALRDSAAGNERLAGLPFMLLPLMLAKPASPESSPDYGPAFESAGRALAGRLAVDRPEANPPGQLFEELRQVSPEEQVRLCSSEERYAQPGLVHHLIDFSYSLRYERPDQMLHWADMARLAADGTPKEAVGSEAKLFDLRARAWGYFGNALRVYGRLQEAEWAISKAQSLSLKGTGDLLLKARLLEISASLNNFQRKFPQAISLFEQATHIYRELEQDQLWATSRIALAIAHHYAQDSNKAVEIITQAIPRIDPRDARLLLTAHHNLATFHLHLGQLEQSWRVLANTKHLYDEVGDSLVLLRLKWHEGQLLRDLGRFHEAEETLLATRQDFEKYGLGYESALVSLDLATVYEKLGLADKVRQSVTEALPTFRSLNIDREILASVLLTLRSL